MAVAGDLGHALQRVGEVLAQPASSLGGTTGRNERTGGPEPRNSQAADKQPDGEQTRDRRGHGRPNDANPDQRDGDRRDRGREGVREEHLDPVDVPRRPFGELDSRAAGRRGRGLRGEAAVEQLAQSLQGGERHPVPGVVLEVSQSRLGEGDARQ